MTTREEEMRVQEGWRAKGDQRFSAISDELLTGEFLSPSERRVRHSNALKTLVDFAMSETDYYAKALEGLPESTLAFEDPSAALAELPVLTKADIQLKGASLRARRLPKGQEIAQKRQSSGTTGPPTVVYHTNVSRSVSPFVKQREYRWFRFEPDGVMASIRLPSQLPRSDGGRETGIGEVALLEGWPFMDGIFETGRAYGYSVFNPVEQQRDWLNELEPDYLTSYPESLEHLAFASAEVPLNQSFKGLHAISEMLTPGMARHVEAAFGASVVQNYGLNEVGIVAAKCREGGRYHVHDEFALVEITDDDGLPAAPGETGRILITYFGNLALPLIRYDTGDLAKAVAGECRCGRSLPGFGEIIGRYSRIAHLPEGTLGNVAVLRDALDEMAPEMAAPLRKFQVQHYRDGRFELRLVSTADLSDELLAYVLERWASALGADAPALNVVRVEDIARGPGGKFQEFMSEFMPSPDEEAADG